MSGLAKFWAWFSNVELKIDGEAEVVAPTPLAKPDAARSKEQIEAERVAAMRDLVAKIEAELERMRVEAFEAIEKPVGKYRIYKSERADASCGQDGYYVQAWTVCQSGWELAYRTDRLIRARQSPEESELYWKVLRELPESFYLKKALTWDWMYIPLRHTEISWHNIGSANPHATYEDAAEWLRKWIRPEVEEVYFDAAAEPIEKAA